MYWWERYFGSDDYLLLEGVPRQSLIERCVDFICGALEVGPGSRVLDVGCGTGRYALALARRGCLVTGVDSSTYMIDRCRRLAVDEPRLTVRRVDFRKMSFRGEFEAVVCLGHTLGYGTREDDAEAVRRMMTSLISGGAILIDLHNLAWYRNNVLGRTWRETEGEFILSDMAYDEGQQKLVSREIIVPKDAGCPREYRATFLEYQPSEIACLLESAGAMEIKFHGDACASEEGSLFSPAGFNERSHVMIVTGRKGGD